MLNFDCKGYKNYDSETLKLCLVSKKIEGKYKRKNGKNVKVKEKKYIFKVKKLFLYIISNLFNLF